MNEEFYIGYLKVAPARLARYVFATAAGIAVLLTAAAMTIGVAQMPPGNGTYAYGRVETFEGAVHTEPYLHLVIGALSGEHSSQGRAALLVGQGKHGAPHSVRDAENRHIRLDATPIERNGTLMLEIAGAEPFEILGDVDSDSAMSPDPGEQVTLIGELVDTKCYLGVMNPGRGKVHRGCAAECLRGGVPPGLLVRDADGNSHLIVLEPADSTVPEIAPDWAARTMVVAGVLHNASSLRVLKYKRLEIYKVSPAP